MGGARRREQGADDCVYPRSVSATRHSNGVPAFDLVVVVGSQGALHAFQVVLAGLPAEFPAALIFDLHRRSGDPYTERLLERFASLRVREATDGDELTPGVLYVAPADRQLSLSDERLLSVGAPDGASPGHRSADALLISAAAAFGPRLIAVVLSGRLAGGAIGVRAAKLAGARVLVQRPDTAAAPSMPSAALATGCVDFALPADSLGPALTALCAAPGAAELFRVRLNAGARS